MTCIMMACERWPEGRKEVMWRGYFHFFRSEIIEKWGNAMILETKKKSKNCEGWGDKIGQHLAIAKIEGKKSKKIPIYHRDHWLFSGVLKVVESTGEGYMGPGWRKKWLVSESCLWGLFLKHTWCLSHPCIFLK